MGDDGALTVAERLERIEGTQRETLDMVRELSSRDRADVLRFENLAGRVRDVEAWQRWAVRAVVAAVLAAVLGAVFVT